MRIEATPHQACYLSRLRERAGVRALPPPAGEGWGGGQPRTPLARRQPLTPTLSPEGREQQPRSKPCCALSPAPPLARVDLGLAAAGTGDHGGDRRGQQRARQALSPAVERRDATVGRSGRG